MNQKRKQTEQMAIDYKNGMTCRQISEIYGISPQALWHRFKRLGVDRIYRTPRPETIDKTQLERLYLIKQLAIPAIARFFGVTGWVIKSALKYHQIPKRPRIKKPGKYVDLLRRLNIGESLEFDYSGKNPRSVLNCAAKTADIKISFQSLSPGKFKVTRIINPIRKLSKLDLIDKEELEQLYIKKRLPVSDIAKELGCNSQIIYNALELHKIPSRKPLECGGKIIDLLRKLSVGETIEIESRVKYPVTNLHTIARRAGVKISVCSLEDSLFSLTKVGDIDSDRLSPKK